MARCQGNQVHPARGSARPAQSVDLLAAPAILGYDTHLHLSRGLQPEARYFTRSSFVNICTASGATATGAAVILTRRRCGPLKV